MYLSRKSSQRKNLWVLWFHFYHNNLQLEWLLQAPWGHEPWRKGGSRGRSHWMMANFRAAILSITHDQLRKPGNKRMHSRERGGNKSGELTVSRETYPTASLCESSRSQTVLSIHGSNQISTVSLQVQTQADWKTNKNRLCISIQGVRVSPWAPACYRCLTCVLRVYVA